MVQACLLGNGSWQDWWRNSDLPSSHLERSERSDGVNGVIHCAGINLGGPLMEMTSDELVSDHSHPTTLTHMIA
jgi:hypothetical protein